MRAASVHAGNIGTLEVDLISATAGDPDAWVEAQRGLRHNRAMDDGARIDSLHRTGLLDTGPDPSFDAITNLVATACDVPIALVSLLDRDRQWFKSRVGLDAPETPRDQAFCAHTIQEDSGVLTVDDASTDPRFAGNPLVTGPPGIRFYAGAAVRAPDGQRLGSVCIIDRRPRTLDDRLRRVLTCAAEQVEQLVAAWAARDTAIDDRVRAVSAHRALADEIEQRSRFFAIAQHKLKTPLAVIAGWSDILRSADGLGAEERGAGLEAIRRAASELQTQIEDLLDEARIHLLHESLVPTPIELGQWLERQVAELNLDPSRHPVSIRVPAGTVVLADPDALRHVVAHLIDNAVKYSPDGGAVAIEAAATGDRVVARVADHGIGLPEDGTDLFEAFQRGSQSARVARGSGLGLHIVRSLVERMDGEVSARNWAGGAMFEFELPAAEIAVS